MHETQQDDETDFLTQFLSSLRQSIGSVRLCIGAKKRKHRDSR